MTDEWLEAWKALRARVGEDVGGGEILWGPDAVEAGAVRRLLEPLEFDCPLHHDRSIAQAEGYKDIISPYTGIIIFTLPALWSPGEQLFTSAERNAQPDVKALRPHLPAETPPFTGYFATDIEMDFLREVVVGERLGRRGQRLVACNPKETRVGRGAFLTFESDILTENGEVVARMRSGMFCYNPPGDEA